MPVVPHASQPLPGRGNPVNEPNDGVIDRIKIGFIFATMRQLFPIFFLIAFLGFVVGVNIYFSKRFSWYFGISQISKLYIASALLTLFMLGGIIVFSNSVSSIGRMAYMLASVTMGFTLYLIMSVLLVDLVHFFVRLKPAYYGMAALSLAALVFISGIWNAYNPKTTFIEVPIAGITREIRALHISDVHLGHFRGKAYLQKVVDKAKKLDPDLVFLTGDLFDGKIQLNRDVIAPLGQLEMPVYFVEGNHDGYSGPDRIKQELRATGIVVMENEVINWGEIQIIGLNYMPADAQSPDMHARTDHSTVKETIANLDLNKQKPSILLHHSPVGIRYANEQGVDLYLAGHTHGGQLFPVNYIVRLMFRYSVGLHEYNGTNIYVSQGTGTFGPPLRIGTRSELAVITLKPELP
jgi:predicted MPP superfamily phosphohydrolase